MLADLIRVSSNIALVKFARLLEPGEQYGVLRDFGFGAPTGVEFPSEATGRLRPPAQWTRPSAASLAIGYELSVTPLQLAAAYGAIANDGVLLEPTLLKEIRSPAGDVLYRHRPAPVRRVVTADVARRLRELLHGAAQRGTGEEGTLATFQIAAKTGTARRVVGGRYAPGEYTASFAALFPADHPQLVVVVKIDNPRKGSYFAAHTAAPVTRAMLQQALAARQVALDRASLTDAGGAPVALATPAGPPPPAAEEAGGPALPPSPLPPDRPRRTPAARPPLPGVTGPPPPEP